MNTLWRLLKQHTWLMLLPLFLTAYGPGALAAQTPSFSATSSLSDFAISADGFLMRGAKKVAF